MTDEQHEVKRRAGRLGGLATAAKYGQGYMAKIGKRGAATLWRRYGLRPYQLSGWALIDRESGEVKRTW